ncbi:GNAT family N-acetyltransferase [Streptomyces sp. NPDC059696]|uniref:GNAT family N-acetyltransferase n=1 Tax=Streptomyces sp. NPDC059696 TaxID=3346911 RepID=UPI0036CEC238
MEIRPTTTEKDFDVFVDTVHAAFGHFRETPVEGGGLWWSALEADRCLIAQTTDGRPVGTAATHSFELTLPGGTLAPAPGVTAVGVLPSHRRQGVLTAMMRHQLTALRTQGAFLSVLLASEAMIYGRFGFGPATYTGHLQVPRHRSALAAPRGVLRGTAVGPGTDTATGTDNGRHGGGTDGEATGTAAGTGNGQHGGGTDGEATGTAAGTGNGQRGGGTDGEVTGTATGTAAGTGKGPDGGSVEVLRRAECGEILEEVYDRYRRATPGALSRPRRWWAVRAGQPPISPAPRYVAVHRNAEGTPDGYASYSIDSGTLTVDETITTDDTVFSALARFALGHDLVTKVVFKHVPPEHPLRWQLVDFRAGEVSGAMDWLWVRLLDVPRALTARGWLTDGELVLDVDDPFLGEHDRYLLTVRAGKAECVPTDREPDLSLDIRDLGSLYLGGTSPSTLVRAGHIRTHHPGATTRADTLFRTERPPHCLHWF